MDLRRVGRRISTLLLAGLAGAGSACGGGGGGSGGSGGAGAGFVLLDVKIGRLVDDGSGARLVSPLTTASYDAVTGRLVPGTLEPLASGVDVDAVLSFGIGADYLPRVVPRNGVLQLEFSAAIDPASVKGDVVDESGALVQSGSVQVRMQDDRPVRVEVSLVAPAVIRVDPVTDSSVGFPASPVDFGPGGQPRADATGFLRLKLPRSGGAVLRATSGSFLAQRADGLGDPSTPIGFNPGNRVLDFIAQGELIPTTESFNGFLPDLQPPRIVRTHAFEAQLDFADGDGADPGSITDASATFSETARSGAGEWAGGRLILRPGAADEESHEVAGNTRTTVTIAGAFALPPSDGDTFRLERAELFEPDLDDPIDPARFDPANPENSANTDLASFVEAFEIDALGNAVAGPIALRDGLPPYSELRVRFDEPISEESLLQWETFRVALFPDEGEDRELLADVFLDATQTVATIRPARVDAAAGTFEVVGWGKAARSLQLLLQTVPKPSYLQQWMASDDLFAFLDEGRRSLLDLGGQPLSFPRSRFDPAAPQIRFAAPFATDESRSTQDPPPIVGSFGVIVHRMRGRPVTGVDPATGEPGVGWRDQPNYYRPIADVNLQANGVLAGAPVVSSTKVHDDYFPPPYGQFGKFPLGVPEPIATPNAAAGPQPHDGARFQTVWRDVDCSPSRDALAGTLLDLYRVSWAPIGGNVTTDTYDNVSIHCGHSPFRPSTSQNGGGANNPYSGLSQPFDYDSWITLIDPSATPACPGPCYYAHGPNWWDALVTCVAPGTSYTVTQTSLFAPPFDGNAYHPWPEFAVRFQYNNGDLPQEEKDLRAQVNADFNCSGGSANPWFEYRTYNSNPALDNLGGDSLLFEARIRPQKTNISRQNGFTISIGILLSSFPNFRVWSVGESGTTFDPDDVAGTQAARCAVGRIASGGLYGDNSRYFAVFDFVKTTSRITSPYVRVHPSDTIQPDYLAPIVQPPLSAQPAGTSVLLEFEGASGVKGSGGTGFSTNVDVADGRPNVAFRATLVGNVTTLLLPNFDTIAIPYRRPFGD